MRKIYIYISGAKHWNNLIRKFQNLYRRILLQKNMDTLSTKEQSLLSTKLQNIYHRLEKMQHSVGLKLAGTTLALMLTAASANAQIAFTEQTGTANPFNGASIGGYAAPALIDIDNDGDFDMFIGNGMGKIQYFKNTGTNSAPIFTEQIGAANPLNAVDANGVSFRKAPAFVDIDNDGDFDLFLGDATGKIQYFKNTGTNTLPVFNQQTGAANPLNGFNILNAVAPTFVDIDNDGDKDLFYGEPNGYISYYKNTGNNIAPVFTMQTGAENPFNGVDVGSNSSPIFVDIDNDGDFDAFVGCLNVANQGAVNFYKNTGTNSAPVFVAQSGVANPLNAINTIFHSKLTFADIDNDGDQDAFFGDMYGLIYYYKNTSVLTAPEIDLQGNDVSIIDGDITASLIDFTDFDSVVVGSNLVRTYTIKNTGTANLNVSTISLSGTDASLFAVGGITLPAVVSASGSKTFTVTYAPIAVGTHNATVNIANNDANEAAYDFAIKGTGTAPEIDLQGNDVSIIDGDITASLIDFTDFGSVVINSNLVRTYTIKNTGTANLNVSTISLNGTDASLFAVGGITLPAVVSASGSKTFTVTYAPIAVGTHNATVNIANNDANEAMYDFAIKGTATSSNSITTPSEKRLDIFSNRDKLFINNAKSGDCFIFDMYGKLVKTITNLTEMETIIDMETGIYVVKVINNHQIKTRKITITK